MSSPKFPPFSFFAVHKQPQLVKESRTATRFSYRNASKKIPTAYNMSEGDDQSTENNGEEAMMLRILSNPNKREEWRRRLAEGEERILEWSHTPSGTKRGTPSLSGMKRGAPLPLVGQARKQRLGVSLSLHMSTRG